MLFSVIVPMYNVSPYAEKCIASILEQTFSDFELIIVDDGSTDGTSAIIDSFSAKDKRINVIHKANGGLVSARKAGVKLATGEYVAVVDGDDWIKPDYLRAFYDAISKYNPDLVMCGFEKTDEQNYESHFPLQDQTEAYYEGDEWKNLKEKKLFRYWPNVWSKAFKRDTYMDIQLRISEEISLGEDGCVTYPYLSRSNSMCIINICNYYYRVNPQSLTKSRKKMIPWSSAIWRAKFFSENLSDSNGIREQLRAYVVHAIYSVISTSLHYKSVREVSSEVEQHVHKGSLGSYMKQPLMMGTREEKLAYYIIKYRLLCLVKIIEGVRRSS